MPGPILHVGAVVMCAHGGQAIPTVPSPVVMVSGMPIATIAAPYAVAGCAFVPPAGNGPCVTGAVGNGRDAGFVARAAGGDPVGRVGLRADGNSAGAGIGADSGAGDVERMQMRWRRRVAWKR